MLKHPCHVAASLLSRKHSPQCLQGGVLTKGISQVSSSFSTHIVGIKTAQSTHTDITHLHRNNSTDNNNNAQTTMPCVSKTSFTQTLHTISERLTYHETSQPGVKAREPRTG